MCALPSNHAMSEEELCKQPSVAAVHAVHGGFHHCTEWQHVSKFHAICLHESVAWKIPVQERQLRHTHSCASALLHAGSDFGGKREAADADSIETASRYTGTWVKESIRATF